MAVFTLKSGDSEDQVHVTPGKALLVAISGTIPTMAPGWGNFGQSTPLTMSCLTTSTILLTPNPSRMYASFTNNSNQSIYLQYGIDAEWQVGYVVRPNSSWIINLNELYLGQVSGISLGSPVDIDVIEGIL